MSKQILVIDDSETERLFISELARKIEDVSCDVAANFSEAKDRLSEKSYDLVLVDAYMPEGTGDSLWNEILERNPDEDTKPHAVIMGRESDFEDGYLLKNGFANFIEKPVGFNMLKAAISLYA
ncbi:response regulator [Butyrivibrio sp. FC2001]|uniref:response regulator n=1 Tax=Butyrivibrio sp. FC2001 TaxID=1280671 RepID=UPI000416C922|nr:response regulator [Butyrivibrio sp. FC2001]